MKVAALWLAFVACTAARVLQKRINAIPIAYRSVSARQAAYYQSWGTIKWQPPTSSFSGSSDQLGQGAYLSPAMGDWPGPINGYYCAVLADSTAWNNVNKVFIPAATSDECPKPLWYSRGVPNRPGYLTTIGGSGYTIDNTVLVSQIEGLPDKWQFLIPPALLSSSNPLSISVQCAAMEDKEAWQALANAYGRIAWTKWQGLRGPVPADAG